MSQSTLVVHQSSGQIGHSKNEDIISRYLKIGVHLCDNDLDEDEADRR